MNVYLYQNNTEKILKNAYIWEYVPRQPSSDTLIYYPLTSNLVDQMWHGNTGTAHWNVTFNSTTWCRVLGKNSSIYADGMSLWINWRLNFTLNFRAKYDTDSTNSSWCLVWYWTNIDTTQCFKLEYFAWQSPAKVRMRLLGNITVPTSATSVVSPTWPLLWEWYNYCITMNNWVCKMYGNWEHLKFSTEYDSVTFSSVNNISELQLWWWWSYGSWRSANWYIKDYIVETVAWDADRISDYYNYTKSNYWL